MTNPIEVLGLDNILAIFCQMFWHLVGDLVTKLCLDILNEKGNLGKLNQTFTTLILKMMDPKLVPQFCLINPYNVVCKIIDKGIPNILKPIMPAIISQK